ncbi:MazG nucleotide pyrophosphohydrolase domain-containing protein [Rhodococcus sp. NPDC003348]
MDRLWSYSGWEVTQTHDSLRRYLLEETYELLDAIEEGDPVDSVRSWMIWCCRCCSIRGLRRRRPLTFSQSRASHALW